MSWISFKVQGFPGWLLFILKSFGIALVSLLLGFLIRRYFLTGLEGRIIWVTFYPAVVIAAVFGGWLAGILTTLGSCLIAIYGWSLLWTHPFIHESADWLGLMAFAFNCGLIVWVSQLSRLAKARAEIAQQQAEASNKAKSVFLASMSHEIRTPMNAILGFAELLKRDSRIPKDAQNHVQTILKSGKHLLGVINDVLDMSRIEAGKASLNLQVMSLSELLQDIEILFQPKARANNLKFTVELNENLPPFIFGDLGKIRQILLNLTGNAFKFTSEGFVSLNAKLSGNNIVIEVEDSGAGIDSQDRERIFKPFERVNHTDELTKGTGLGLSISTEFARIMNGKIDLESNLGKGSIFRFQFPFTTANVPSPAGIQKKQRARLLPEWHDTRILVVDDNSDNRNLLCSFLQPLGFKTQEATDGLEAISKVENFQPRVILMDLLMPHMNGVEATRIIRQSHSSSHICIIGISASAFEEDRTNLLEAGCNTFLPKPIQMENLLNILEEFCELRFQEGMELDNPPRAKPDSDLPLPLDWVKKFSLVIQQGNINKALQAIPSIQETHPFTYQFLKSNLEAYQWNKIKTWVQEVNHD